MKTKQYTPTCQCSNAFVNRDVMLVLFLLFCCFIMSVLIYLQFDGLYIAIVIICKVHTPFFLFIGIGGKKFYMAMD